ncbi:MAG: hypothetical protein ABDH28_02010 [Brevinematia bacterium]
MNFVKLVFVIILSLVIPLGLTLTYCDSPRTKVKNMKITQNIDRSDAFVCERIVSLFSNKSIFEVDKLTFEKEIESFSSGIKEVSVFIYPPDSVHISVMYREPVIKVFVGGNTYILYDEELNEVKNYDRRAFESAVTVVQKVNVKKELLQDIARSVYSLDRVITLSKYFPDTFIVDRDGVYGFNSKFKINIYFGHSVDESKIKKAFLSTRYIIQKGLPVRYIDARFDNVIAN